VAFNHLCHGRSELAGKYGYAVLPPAQRYAHMIGLRHPSGIQPGLSAHLIASNIYASAVIGLFDALRAANN
jgi:hypothetical protein